MKALTLLQPWASLMVTQWPSGRFCKMLETRRWSTKYRGPIAIHSSAQIPKGTAKLVCSEPFYSAFGRPGAGPGPKIVDMTPMLPTGVVLGIGRLVDCMPVESALSDWRMTDPPGGNGESYNERHFGDYTPGRFAWLSEEMHPLKEPVPVRGMLAVWDWQPNEEAQQILNLLAQSTNHQ